MVTSYRSIQLFWGGDQCKYMLLLTVFPYNSALFGYSNGPCWSIQGDVGDFVVGGLLYSRELRWPHLKDMSKPNNKLGRKPW